MQSAAVSEGDTSNTRILIGKRTPMRQSAKPTEQAGEKHAGARRIP